MIFVNSEKDVVDIYIMEGLRRLWSASVDENGETVSFDYFYNHSPKVNGKIHIPYDDVYCPFEEQIKIINDLVNESYCMPSGKTYKLKRAYANLVQCRTSLGPSPSSSKEHFIEQHPNFKKIEKKFI